MIIQIKRIYQDASPYDGYRVLVDRLWPRGIKKESAKTDEWLKKIAPSNELRNWFKHDPAKWGDFKKAYRSELKSHMEELQALLKRIEGSKLTLLYSAKDEKHNNAVVLKEYLEEMKKS